MIRSLSPPGTRTVVVDPLAIASGSDTEHENLELSSPTSRKMHQGETEWKVVIIPALKPT